jgi:hypothetical protein
MLGASTLAEAVLVLIGSNKENLTGGTTVPCSCPNMKGKASLYLWLRDRRALALIKSTVRGSATAKLGQLSQHKYEQM